MIKRDDILKAIDELVEINNAYRNSKYDEHGALKFYTAGTGIPDSLAIDFFRNSNVVVITRDGAEYLHGEIKE